MAKKDIELDFASGANNSEKLKALQAAMDKIEKQVRSLHRNHQLDRG